MKGECVFLFQITLSPVYIYVFTLPKRMQLGSYKFVSLVHNNLF